MEKDKKVSWLELLSSALLAGITLAIIIFLIANWS